MSEVPSSGAQDSYTDVEVSSVLVVSGTTLTVTATVDGTNVIAISSASASHGRGNTASRSVSLTRQDTSSSSSSSVTEGDSAPSDSDSNRHDGPADRKTIAIAISFSVVAFAVISLLLVIFLRRRAGRHRLRATSPLTDSSTHASTGTRFDTTIRPFTLALSPSSPPEPQRSKTSTRDHCQWQPTFKLQVPGRDAVGHDEPGPPRPSIDSARTRVAV